LHLEEVEMQLIEKTLSITYFYSKLPTFEALNLLKIKMKKPFINISKKHVSLKVLSNRYMIVLLFFVVWISFLDDASYLRHRTLNKEIKDLEKSKKYYQNEIIKDQKQINELQEISKIEQYAREKYYMKKPNEDVYIIEYENDTIE